MLNLKPGSGWRAFNQTATGSWVALPTLSCISVGLRAPLTNSANILLSHAAAPTAAEQINLAPGQSISIDVANLNQVFIKAASGSPVLEGAALLSLAQS